MAHNIYKHGGCSGKKDFQTAKQLLIAMIGDILLINDNHRRAARELAKKVLEHKSVKENEHNGHYKYVVGISGESGAGKSELSYSLALELKKQDIRVKVMHADNYYLVPPLLRREWRMTHGVESVGMDEYDWEKVNQNIRDFREDRVSTLPYIDILSGQIDTLTTDFQKIHLLVVDGLYAIRAEDIDLRVFIELTYLETKMAQLVRGKESHDDFRIRVLEKEHQNVLSLKPMADLLVNRDFEIKANPDKAAART